MASNVFYAQRTKAAVDSTDHQVPMIKLAKSVVDTEKKIARSSVFGLLTRKTFFREGQGAVVIDNDFNTNQDFLIPKRTKVSSTIPYPYGNGAPLDTIFSNIDYTLLNKAIANAFVENQETFQKNTRSLVVLYKGQLIAENYAKGFDKNTPFLGWSMAKSLLSGIFGAYVQQSKFDIHQPVINSLQLPEWEKDERATITTHHLLKMISGLEWEEDYSKISDVTKMLFLERDMTLSQAKKSLEFTPETHFNYSSGTTNLIAGVLRSKFSTHQAYLDFAYTDFIDKIGMNSLLFETDMEGNYVGSSYAWATARDWAKFGLLYLNKGNWNGTQIFSKDWVAYTATPTKVSDNEYGAQFWTNTEGFFSNAPRDMYYADGYHGQRIFIIPSKELVIVRTGLTHKGRTDSYEYLNELLRDILNCIQP